MPAHTIAELSLLALETQISHEALLTISVNNPDILPDFFCETGLFSSLHQNHPTKPKALENYAHAAPLKACLDRLADLAIICGAPVPFILPKCEILPTIKGYFDPTANTWSFAPCPTNLPSILATGDLARAIHNNDPDPTMICEKNGTTYLNWLALAKHAPHIDERLFFRVALHQLGWLTRQEIYTDLDIITNDTKILATCTQENCVMALTNYKIRNGAQTCPA